MKGRLMHALTHVGIAGQEAQYVGAVVDTSAGSDFVEVLGKESSKSSPVPAEIGIEEVALQLNDRRFVAFHVAQRTECV